MSGIGVIINPYSRSHKKDPNRRDRLGFIIGDKGSCHITESLDDVRKLAREFKKKNIEILGISGGDGTNHVTLTIFLEEYKEKPLPKIALLRGGTMNNLANELGLKGDTEKILSNLILNYHSGNNLPYREIDLLKVNGFYGFVFGCGLITRFIKIYMEGTVEPTPQKGLKLLAHAVASALVGGRFSKELCRRFDAEITIDGKKMPFKNYTMLFAGTMETLGFNFRPLYRVHDCEGQFQLVGISSTQRQLLYTLLPQAVFAKPSNSNRCVDEIGKTAVIEFDQPQKYILDGDFPEDAVKRIEIGIGQRLKFITQ